MIRAWPMALLLTAVAAQADESVAICFNYGCNAERPVVFSDRRLAQIGTLLASAPTAARERQLLAQAVGHLYAWAAEQTPIGVDRGGNYADDGQRGRMDCIDHSTTTDRFLRLIERHGWLRFHRVTDIVVRHRWLFGQHFSAVVEQKDDGARFVIDSWFVDNGRPAVVLPLAKWQDGEDPDE
jgi:hypothetical protein